MLRIWPDGLDAESRWALFDLGFGAPTSWYTAQVPAGTAALWLDPAATSPNVLLGVEVAGDRYVMRPGQVFPVNGGRLGARVRLFNPLPTDLQLYGHIAPLVGAVGLRALSAQEAAIIAASPATKTPPGLSCIFAGRIVTTTPVADFSVANLSWLRIGVRAISAAAPSTDIITEPADFAATLRPACSSGEFAEFSGASVIKAGAGSLRYVPLARPFDLPSNYSDANRLATKSADLDLAFSQNQLGADLEVGGACPRMRLTLESVSGTGVSTTGLLLIVEGR